MVLLIGLYLATCSLINAFDVGSPAAYPETQVTPTTRRGLT
jgi:hypothetical protein